MANFASISCTFSVHLHVDRLWKYRDNIGSGNGLVPLGNKSLPESALIKIRWYMALGHSGLTTSFSFPCVCHNLSDCFNTQHNIMTWFYPLLLAISNQTHATATWKSFQWRRYDRDGVSNHRRPIVCPTICSGIEQRKHQSSASLVFARGIHRWPYDSPHKGRVTRKMFPFNDVIMVPELSYREKLFGVSVYWCFCYFNFHQ